MSFLIGARPVGSDSPVFIVAELSANHGQSLETARELVHAAAEAGVDAVKLQTYTADTLTIDCDSEPFRIGPGGLWSGRTLYELYAEAHTPWEWHRELFELAASLGLLCFSSPFDPTAVAFLEDLEVPAYKVASPEIIDIGLLKEIATTGKPVIVSTGMASDAEIAEALDALQAGGSGPVALLHCVSAYPARPEDMHLQRIPALATTFDLEVGLSDHTLGTTIAVAAVSLGASVVEKHLTLTRAEPGPDSAFSLEPQEFAELVRAVREVESALGSRQDDDPEAHIRPFRRSLFVVEDVAAGERFTATSVRSIRPGGGLHPRDLEEVLGLRAAVDIPRGTPLSWDLVRRQVSDGD